MSVFGRTALSLVAVALFGQFCTATTMTFTDSIGPNGTGIVVNPFVPPFNSVYSTNWRSSLNGTDFSGQTVRLTLLFDGFFVRFYPETKNTGGMTVGLLLPYLPFWTTPTPPPGSPSITGTATLLNAAQEPITGAIPLFTGLNGGPTFQPSLGADFVADFTAPPTDIYGVQYDLTLSNSPGKSFAVAPTSDSLFFSGFFGVGPNIPADLVPDNGSSVVLLTLGLLVIVCLHKLHGNKLDQYWAKRAS